MNKFWIVLASVVLAIVCCTGEIEARGETQVVTNSPYPTMSKTASDDFLRALHLKPISLREYLANRQLIGITILNEDRATRRWKSEFLTANKRPSEILWVDNSGVPHYLGSCRNRIVVLPSMNSANAGANICDGPCVEALSPGQKPDIFRRGCPAVCDDGDLNTVDSCNEATGKCTHAPTSARSEWDKIPWHWLGWILFLIALLLLLALLAWVVRWLWELLTSPRPGSTPQEQTRLTCLTQGCSRRDANFAEKDTYCTKCYRPLYDRVTGNFVHVAQVPPAPTIQTMATARPTTRSPLASAHLTDHNDLGLLRFPGRTFQIQTDEGAVSFIWDKGNSWFEVPGNIDFGATVEVITEEGQEETLITLTSFGPRNAAEETTANN